MCERERLSGLVCVDKPAGMTSHDVINVVRRLYGTRKVGHAGTLDPDATGLLLVCLEQATRLLEYLGAGRKNYVAGVKFGIETDTQDASGQVTASRSASHLRAEDVECALERFRGKIRQIPPMVSALHHEGKRLYELARAGEEVEREAREIEIYRLELLEFRAGAESCARIEATCSSGTYIRTLAADIGEALGTGAHMSSLRRTWVSGIGGRRFEVEHAWTLEVLRARAEAGSLSETIMPMAESVSGWRSVTLGDAELSRILSGQRVPLGREGGASEMAAGADDSPVAVLDANGNLCAVGLLESDNLKPVKVLMPR